MEPEVAKYHFGALALAVADSIASVSASFSPSGPATAVMVFLSMEPGLPISVLASRIRLSHAGTVRLIDRLEHEQLVERRRQSPTGGALHSPHQFREEDNGSLAQGTGAGDLRMCFAPFAQ
jgi:transcriptional regulator, MarR family